MQKYADFHLKYKVLISKIENQVQKEESKKEPENPVYVK